MVTDKQKRVIIWCRVSSEEQGAANKESIPDQLGRQRELAYQNNWLIIDEIIADFSMDYFTYAEFAEAAAAKGWTDPLRMWTHWEQKDFDILTCRYLDRVGREQSILSEFIGRTMKASARIVPLDEASVDLVNHRMTSAIAGLGAATHVDKMKAGRNIGMTGRAKRGETVGIRVPLFYAIDADKKMYPDRANYQRLFDDIYELFISGMPYKKFHIELEQRGHFNPLNGRRYSETMVKRLLCRARTWGHAEFNRTGVRRGVNNLGFELWCTGRADPPADVVFKENVFEPIWLDQQRENMIDEFERRYYAIRGAARPHNTYAFSQLCVCSECGRKMICTTRRKLQFVVCDFGRLHRGCDNHKRIRADVLQEYMAAYIKELFNNPNADMTRKTPNVPKSPAFDTDIANISAKIADYIQTMHNQIPALRGDYQIIIDKLQKQREVLHIEKARHEQNARVINAQKESQLRALEELRQMKLETFWSRSSTFQNQMMRKILGRLRIEVLEGEVKGLRAMS